MKRQEGANIEAKTKSENDKERQGEREKVGE